jgi:hypothetical protein
MNGDKFRERVTKLPGWNAALKEFGLVVTAGYRNAKVLQRV